MRKGPLSSDGLQEMKNSTVRSDDDTRNELERVANVGGVTPADVIRMCVKYGLPIVEHGFNAMAQMLEEKIPHGKRDGKR